MYGRKVWHDEDLCSNVQRTALMDHCVVQPLDAGLSDGLFASPALVQVGRHTTCIPTVNTLGCSVLVFWSAPWTGLVCYVCCFDIDQFSVPAEEQRKVRCSHVFSVHNGDVGCTDPIAHEISLLDNAFSVPMIAEARGKTECNTSNWLHPKAQVGQDCKI